MTSNESRRPTLEFPCGADPKLCRKRIKRCMKGCLDTAVCSCFGMKIDYCLDFACPCGCFGNQQADEKLFLKVSARLIGHGQLDAEIKLEEKNDANYLKTFLCHTSTVVRCSYNILAWTLLIMAVFEPPPVADVFPIWALWGFELFSLSYFLFYTYRNRNYVDLSDHCDYRNTVTIVACVGCLADCIGSIILYYSGVGMSIRYSRPLRPIFIANSPFAYQLRKAITCTVKTVRDVTFAMIMLMGSVLLYAVLAYRLFSPKNLKYPDGLPWFPSFGVIMWELYVLMTTANSPDVMLPIFNVNPSTCIFFVSYLLLNFYLFMGFVLAVVVDTYKKHMKRDVINYVLAKRRALDQAFHLVSEETESGELVVTRKRFSKLMRYLKPHYGSIQREIVFLMLDPSEEGHVGKDKFLSLSEFLNVEIVLGIGPTNCVGQAFPHLYASKYSMMFVKLANSSFFSYAVDIFILLNVILYIANCDQVELVFLTVFTAEILLKLYGMNTRTFWQNSWNKFDVLVVLGAWAVELLDIDQAGGDDHIQMADMILVLRILRITRVMRLIPGFRNIVATLRNIMPSLVSFGNILVLLYYLYAMVGMELFGGRIVEDGSANCGNPKLNMTEFAIKRYCAMNFNNIGHSYLTLFTLMVVNQWHVLTDGYVAVTNSSFRLYFISFHVVAVLIILNIVNAFILEVFLLNYETQQSDVLNAVEAMISKLGLGHKEIPDEDAFLANVDQEEYDNLQDAQDYFVCDRDASRNVWSCLEQLFALDLKELGVRRNYSASNLAKPAKRAPKDQSLFDSIFD